MNNLLDKSDKYFWHRYLDFYEAKFSFLKCQNVLEFGVFQGASVRWLLERFPKSHVFGVDILPVQPDWPKDKRITYFQVDQDSTSQIENLFKSIGERLDLIIEDGSHIPRHQRNCLVNSIPHINSGGIYILEDIHTSHPRHPFYKKAKRIFAPLIGPLHMLLAIDHMISTGKKPTKKDLDLLIKDSLFSLSDIELLYERISSIDIYKRAKLPIRCFKCGNSDFDFHRFRCRCGVPLYSESDSMSALIHIR